MKRLITAAVVALAVSLSGCAQVHVEEDDDTAQQEQALEEDSQSCHDRCMQEFHECREAGKPGGPGASGCAHQKNECKDRC